MNSLLLLHCCLFLIGYSLAANDGNCQIDGITDNDFLTTYSLKINDTQINTNILETTYTGSLDVRSCTSPNDVHSTYFSVTSNDTSFVITTTEAFANFDSTTNKQTNEVDLVTLQCTLFCEAESSLTIQVSVTDINTHPPEFSLTEYEFKVATPIMPLTDFTIYGLQVISVQDIDFSNQAVTFTIEPDDFSISSSTSATSKRYTAVFAARRVVQLIGNRTYTITATDSGTIPGPLSSTTTLTLTVDEENSLDIPSFDSASYSYNYTIVGTTPTLTPINGPITIDTNKPTSLTDATLTGTFSEYFTVTLDLDTSAIIFTIDELLPSNTGSFIVLTLSVSTDNRASTSIIVYPTGINDVPEFSSHYYTGSYSDVNSNVTLDNPITITSARTPDVSISGEYADHFTVTYNEASTSYSISVSTNLTASEIKLQSYITLTLRASLGENFDTAVLILSLPEYDLQFTEALYNATYNSDNTVTVDKNKPIGFATDVANVDISVDATFASNFAVTYDAGQTQWLVVVNKPLDNDTLRAEESVVITLTATDAYDNIAQSVLTIYLPSTSAPEFSETLYLGNYSSNGIDATITLDKNIIISNVDNQADVTITLDSYNENFAISYDTLGDNWKLDVTSALSQETLLSKKQLIITLTAAEVNNDNKGQAVLIITWSNKEAPQFTQTYYLATYPENAMGTIDLESPIGFTNVEDLNNIVITLDSYTDNFEITYNSNTWTIALIKSLDQTVLSKNVELIIILTATETGNDNEGQSVLVIELPIDKKSPKFAEAYYIANYPETGTGTIEFENPIAFTNIDDLATIEISLDSYSENFEILFESSRWYLNIKSGLDKTVLYKNAELVITLIATEIGVENIGESALVLKLPTSANGTAPKFSEAYYLADYPESGTGAIEFKSPVSFINVDDPTEVTISLDNYEDYFEIIYSSNRWYINITTSLKDDVLYENVELVMTLIADEAGNTEKGESALVLKLPSATNGTAPKFSKAYYLAQYPKSGTGTIEFETPIAFLNVDDLSKVTVSLDNFEDNFDITYDLNRWYINIKNSLEQAVLQANNEIVMTLIASEIGNANFGESALVLKLPAAINATAPKFSEAYYLANYPENGTGTIEFETPVEFLNVDDPTTILISLDNYKDNFDIDYDGSKWYINIKESLGEDVVNKNAEIVITLIATESGNTNTGESALVLRLPIANDTVLKFSAAYYLATYPEDGTDTIEFEIPIAFSNEYDPTNIAIALDNYESNFNIEYASNRWYINITKRLDNAVLHQNVELVITLIASETGKTDTAESALVLKLPTAGNGTAPKFLEAYYVAEYPESGTGLIEFETPIEFSNVDDLTSLTISLDNYDSNFEIKYEENKWVINIINILEGTILNDNNELVMTLIASELGNPNQGESALVLKLPSSDTAPIFTGAYYIAEYPEAGTGIIEFEDPINFANVVDPATVEITLDTYTDNFEIKYDNRWYINIKTSLDDSILGKNVEVVMTLVATSTEYKNVGYSALVLNLPTPNDTSVKFVEAYYLAKYPEGGSGIIEFENAVTFLNVDDPTALTISLDNYTSNFAIKYDLGRWYIDITTSLEANILTKNTELVMTMIATEESSTNTAESALVLKLPASNDTAPIFAEPYYIAEYPENGTGIIQFENPIEFLNVNDPTILTLTLSNYASNFAILYEENIWYITIKNSLEEAVLNKNAELVMTITATESENTNEGYATLVLKLPASVNITAPRFAEAYYLAQYPTNDDTNIEFENPIEFLNVDDPKTITIALDNYSDNFDIVYESDRWYITIKDSLETSILNKNSELVMTLIATETGNKIEGYSALVLKLPAVDTAPEFTNAYYKADYPKDGKGTLELEKPIDFLNVDDISTITITLDNYTNNFEISYVENIWTINITKALEEGVLTKETELVMTLTATQTGNINEGRSSLVLKLPATELAPVFSESFYEAIYTLNEGQASVVFAEAINITNKEDLSKIVITVDNYQENFNIVYNSDSNAWIVNVIEELSDTILISKTDIVVGLTATDTSNGLVGHSVVYLNLPSLNTDESPRFSKTYYTAKYIISGETALVTFDTPINITNRNDLTAISIGTDNYADNFRITYDESNNEWSMNVIGNLDEAILNAKVDLVMALIASENSNNIAQSALVLTLPLVNNDEAPKFSRIYYSGDYISDNGTINLENAIEIVNKDNLTKITISFDDSYRDNFEIIYDSDSSQWILNVKTPLTESVLYTTPDLVLTLTATEEDNTNIGQAALVLHLPLEKVKQAPKFSLAHYFATYEVDDDKPSIVLYDSITITNKDLTNITVALDSYDTYFNVNYNSTAKQWTIAVAEPLLDSILNSTSELVLTLVATEIGNDNTGESTLIVKLPSSSEESLLKFSEVHYTANYSIAETSVIMNENIQVVTSQSLTDLTVALESNEYSSYFTIGQEGDNYEVYVQSPLPSEILESQVSLVMTIVAIVDGSTSYATLVINLPVSVTGRSIEFAQTLYTATYEVLDGKANFQVNGTIQVQTDEEDANVDYGISSDTGYQSYFQIAYSNKVVTVELVSDLPENVLRENAFVPIILTVGIRGTTTVSSAVLNVEINYDAQENSTSITFSDVLYHGKYEVTNGLPVLTIEDQITVVTDEPDSNVEVNLTSVSGYAEYFKKSYSNKQITIEIDRELPESILRQNSIIPLILTAGISGTAWRSSAVLNIQIVYNDGGDSTTLIEFSNVLFNGKYEVTDGTGALTIEDQITVVTNESDSTVAVTITNEYESFFTVTYANKIVTVELAKQLSTDTLISNTFIPLTLQAAVTGTLSQASAVLNIRIRYESENDTASIEFGSVLYTGEYSVSDGKGSLEIDDAIRVITDRADAEIETSISNNAGYDRYFRISYSRNIISVGLNGNLPTDLVKNNAFIALTITAGIKETTHRSSAVLNIQIENEDDDDNGDANKSCENDHKTAYIVVIVILSILLVLLIGATIAYYWFKLRERGYENFENDDAHGKVRFDKHAMQRPSTENNPSSIEGRRPTGFIFNPISEDNLEAVNEVDYPKNTGSVHDTEKTRRKSVAFDDNVEKLQIDSISDEDIVSDDNLNEKPEVTHV